MVIPRYQSTTPEEPQGRRQSAPAGVDMGAQICTMHWPADERVEYLEHVCLAYQLKQVRHRVLSVDNRHSPHDRKQAWNPKEA